MSGQEQHTGYEQVTLVDSANLGLRMPYKGVAIDTFCGHNHSKPSNYDGRARQSGLLQFGVLQVPKRETRFFSETTNFLSFPLLLEPLE